MDHSSCIVAHLTPSGSIFLPLGTTSLDILILIPQIIGPYGAPPSMQYLHSSFPASHSVHVHGNLSPSLIPASPACNLVLPMCLYHLPNTLPNVINPALPVVPTRQSTCSFFAGTPSGDRPARHSDTDPGLGFVPPQARLCHRPRPPSIIRQLVAPRRHPHPSCAALLPKSPPQPPRARDPI